MLKHVVLAKIVEHLNLKPAPWSYLDTHAGVGMYDLTGEEADKTGEWRNGVGRIRDRALGAEAEALLAPWRDAMAGVKPDAYPGSPEIVRRLARAGDRLRLCEKHPKDAEALARNFGRDRRVKAVEIDGWTALNAWLPPPERRGLVLIDPPFEEPGEFGRMAERFRKALAVWPTGTYALWYPVKDPADADALAERVTAAGVPKLVRLELLVRASGDPKLLVGSGMLVANPPWRLADEFQAAAADLAAALAQGEGARATAKILANA
ncbi:23S rRNA (adenine(2030)-N(6))-methyltransferase RlmJ [Chelatococcus sambhunathii]|uniref:23S rRNA (adenine(2030)-N(6))-methyltransferase RlmJ n=1 Tax=Chelatococcus sambhunathii TaxID=363953 RepID=UPI00285279B3|nr:23S rRNA (adenine(2030)-N(6))-methyltransferase RlmJ [Chelatococcus sambhunathii]